MRQRIAGPAWYHGGSDESSARPGTWHRRHREEGIKRLPGLATKAAPAAERCAAGPQRRSKWPFEAPRRLAERLVPPMLDRGWGRVVNVTGAIVAKSFNAAGPAKAALESWCRRGPTRPEGSR